MIAVAGLGSAGVAATVLGEPKPVEKLGSARVEFKGSQSPAKLEHHYLVSRKKKAFWPMWGLGPTRSRVVPGDNKLRPPFKVRYVVHGHAMIEYPPVIAYGRFYFGTYKGRLIAARVSDGHIAWQRNLGRCIASSPAVGGHVIYITSMGPAPCRRHWPRMRGMIFALNARSGRILWHLSAGLIESSPLLIGHTLYFASYDSVDHSTIWALNTRTHRQEWTYPAPSKITSSPAYFNHTIYIGAYSTTLYALDARTGKLVYSTRPVGYFSGNHSGFYGTPAIAYGRVYIGGLDGHVYAFGTRTGALRWVRTTDGYVYSSPAVWNGLVFAGSFGNQRFYALGAATGLVRWSFKAEGTIIGSPTVLAGIVYFSTTSGHTYALDAMTGVKIWEFPDGCFSPIVVAGNRVLLTGKGRVYGLDPVHRRPRAAPTGKTTKAK
ncbi:MAG: PQQ-binding-like beta-propeller repeat protein [Gaiellaceae bacterium]